MTEEYTDVIDIFDLSDVSDIPHDIAQYLKIFTRGSFERNIIELFRKAGRQLTIDEVTVAYFRCFSEQVERPKIVTKLYHMSRSKHPVIASVKKKKGVYRLINCEYLEKRDD